MRVNAPAGQALATAPAITLKVTVIPDLEKYASRLLTRVEASDTRYALDLQARKIQVNWLKLPLTKDYSEVVDWSLAMVPRAGELDGV